MTTLISGQRGTLVKFGLDPQRPLSLDAQVPAEVDLALFGLCGGKMRDELMVFYNQPEAAAGWASLKGSRFDVDLSRLPGDVDELVLCASAERSLGGQALPCTAAQGGVTLEFAAGMALTSQKAAKLLRLYRHPAGSGGEWRLEAVGQGFDGGLDALVRHFGGEVQEDVAAPASPAVDSPAPTSPAPGAPAAPVSLTKLDLRKEKVVNLTKTLGIEDIQVRLIVVMDASGSMMQEYLRGRVQETLERLVPIASKMDSDGAIEFLWYANHWADGGTVGEEDMEGFVGNAMPQTRPRTAPAQSKGLLGGLFGGTPQPGGNAVQDIGYGNNEPPVMREVIRRHKEDCPAPCSGLPTLVLFITDGGIDSSKSREIEGLLRESSRHDIFWQYVGLGRSNYGSLERLDTLSGREVDNANFFAVDDIAKISDDELYSRLIGELPKWLTAIKARCAQRGGAGASGTGTNPAPAPVSGSKVSLSKGQGVTLAKSQALRVTLEWDGRTSGGTSDLDLYAFYVLQDGSVGKIYYRNMGRRDQAPFITLDGDSRGAGRETLTVHQPDKLRYVLFAAYSALGNGTGSFASYRPRIIVEDDRGNSTTVPVLGNNTFAYWVALARVDVDRSGAYTVTHVERYSRFGTERSPLLRKDGVVQMNSGPIEFK